MAVRLKRLSALAVLLIAVQTTFAAEGPIGTATATNAAPIELRGRLIHLKNHSLAFKTDSGAVYNVLFTRMSAALFSDTNFISKTLVLKGRMLPGSRFFEVTGNLHAWRDGQLYELYYYCDVCAIKGIEPGECMCCRQPVRLVEEAVGDRARTKTEFSDKKLKRR